MCFPGNFESLFKTAIMLLPLHVVMNKVKQNSNIIPGELIIFTV